MTADEEFKIIKEFVDEKIGQFKKPPKNSTYKYGDDKHLLSLKKSFINSRQSKININEPKTITDDALWEYIKLQKNLSQDKVDEFAKYHKIAMSIETKLGNLLESFIYKYIKNFDWIWCSGNIVQDIDFIKKEIKDDNSVNWIALQVKNSDNSENAASSRVRVGTKIIKWYRRLSRVESKDNWEELINLVDENDKDLKDQLTEKNYLTYLKN
mgnify:FL=1|tara:strand:+ start:229 stop:864 length:636 start_codon:yes stop_codon:yes gene_type:complete